MGSATTPIRPIADHGKKGACALVGRAHSRYLQRWERLVETGGKAIKRNQRRFARNAINDAAFLLRRVGPHRPFRLGRGERVRGIDRLILRHRPRHIRISGRRLAGCHR